MRSSLVVAALLLAASPVRADGTTTARLSFRAIPGCPSESALIDLVAARLARAPFSADGSTEVRVSIEADARGRHLARLELLGPGGASLGRRELRGSSCQELVVSIASSIAIALASLPPPNGVLRPPEQIRWSDPEAPPPLAESESTAPARAPPRDMRLTVEAAVGSAAGMLPTVSIGGSVGVGLRFSRFSLALEGRLDSTPGSVDVGQGLSASLLYGTVGFAPCVSVFSWLRGCVLGYVGVASGESRDVVTPRPVSVLIGMLGSRVAVEWPVSDELMLGGRVELLVPLARPSIHFRGDPVWSSSAVTGALALYAGVVL